MKILLALIFLPIGVIFLAWRASRRYKKMPGDFWFI